MLSTKEMKSLFFLQMSGFPGSGKSTLAREVGKKTGAIVIDHDIVKSALMDSLSEQLDSHVTGKASYAIEWALIDFHLSQGHSVILDSPCFYTEMIDKGLVLCEKHDAQYRYVECFLDDFYETNNRLKKRDKKISQIDQVTNEEGYKVWIRNSKRPDEIKCLIVDTAEPLDNYINDVIEYLQ